MTESDRKQRFSGMAFMPSCVHLLFRVSTLASVTAFAYSPTISPEQLAFFESNIRPVLAEHCHACHSAEAKENLEKARKPN